MKTVALENIVSSTILTFCENAAELGCPRDMDVDMWFRGLSEKDMFEVGDKLLRIQDRECQDDCVDNLEDKIEDQIPDTTNDSDEYIVIDDDLVETVLAFARSRVVNDKQALLNYGVNHALREIIASDGKILEN